MNPGQAQPGNEDHEDDAESDVGPATLLVTVVVGLAHVVQAVNHDAGDHDGQQQRAEAPETSEDVQERAEPLEQVEGLGHGVPAEASRQAEDHHQCDDAPVGRVATDVERLGDLGVGGGRRVGGRGGGHVSSSIGARASGPVWSFSTVAAPRVGSSVTGNLE